MQETTTNRGTIIRVPDQVNVVDDMIPGTSRRRSQSQRPDTPSENGAADDGLLRGLIDESGDTELHDSFVLIPPSSRNRSRRRRGPKSASDEGPVEVEVSVGSNENAALLIESDGVYSWHLPEPAKPKRGRRGSGASEENRFVFRIDGSTTTATQSQRRGLTEWIGKKLVDPIRGTIVKWVAGKAIGPTMRFLERNVQAGLISMAAEDPARWRADGSLITIPTDRPAKILLFVHGTFSSTIGSFGALAETREGRAFLKEARNRYDAILAYDHHTLGESPEENAHAIDTVLNALSPHQGTTVDIVAFSRGGLVTRVLVERYLAQSNHKMQPGKVIFVGCTNGGTALAEPENWKVFLDLHTNLAVAAGRALTFFGAATAGQIVQESVKTLSAFVQAIVETAITDEMVPGIAAMAPLSPLVTDLNSSISDPNRTAERYHAIGSDFEPKFFDEEDATRSLPKKLMRALADGGADALMGEANDLVVDTEAMTQFGNHEHLLAETLIWEANASLFHTIYFTHPEVARSLSRWLTTDSEKPIAATPEVDPDITVFLTSKTVGDVLTDLPSSGPIIVFDRPSYGFYVRSASELSRFLPGADPTMEVGQALDLHEHQVADQSWAGGSGSLSSRVSRMGRVHLDTGQIVGATLPATSLTLQNLEATPSEDVLEKPVEELSAPADDGGSSRNKRRRRGRSPTAIARPSAAPTAPPPPATSTATNITCHFGAEMAENCALGTPAPLTVTVSREELEAITGPTVSQAEAQLRTDNPLSIEVLPQANCRVIGPATVDAVNIPDSGAEIFDFKIEGLGEGTAELHVAVRQGPRRITRMVLQPNFVRLGQSMHAVAVANTASPDPAVVELRIIEEGIDDDRYRLRFIMQSADLQMGAINATHEVNRTKDRVVADFYERMEGEWGHDLAAFDTFLDQVRSYGGQLYNEVIPKSVRQAIWNNRDTIGCIRVISEEPSIPWELLVATDGETDRLSDDSVFLGELGLVRWIDNLHWAPSQLSARPGRTFHVIPEYADPGLRLAGAQREISTIEKLFAAEAVEGSRRSVIDRLKDGGEIDLIHFACHGHAKSNAVWEAELSMAGRARDSGGFVSETLSLGDVSLNADFSREGHGRPIVFINACQAGVTGRSLSGTGGMAGAFILRGAGLFVSTLWSIGDDVAHTFAEKFYETLVDGHTVAEAARAARTAARKAQEPTWIAYTVYGHPYARLATNVVSD